MAGLLLKQTCCLTTGLFFHKLKKTKCKKKRSFWESASICIPSKYIDIAKVCHEANKAYCETEGDHSQKSWDEALDWQRQSAIAGVEFRLNNPDAGHDAQHNAWMKDKIDSGWVYGTEKDSEKKTHPCIVPYEELPEFQKKKDALFCAIVDALK